MIYKYINRFLSKFVDSLNHMYYVLSILIFVTVIKNVYILIKRKKNWN